MHKSEGAGIAQAQCQGFPHGPFLAVLFFLNKDTSNLPPAWNLHDPSFERGRLTRWCPNLIDVARASQKLGPEPDRHPGCPVIPLDAVASPRPTQKQPK